MICTKNETNEQFVQHIFDIYIKKWDYVRYIYIDLIYYLHTIVHFIYLIEYVGLHFELFYYNIYYFYNVYIYIIM